MAPRQVIQDSDEEEEDEEFRMSDDIIIANEPLIELNRVPDHHNYSLPTSSRIGTSSTDPLAFQAIYDAQLADLQTSNETTDGDDMPHLLSDHGPLGISSPPIHVQENKTLIAVDSLTSISDPSEPKRSGRRREALDIDEKLTSVTSPHTSGNTIGRDLWEFPGSSPERDIGIGGKPTLSRKKRAAQDHDSNQSTSLPRLKRIKVEHHNDILQVQVVRSASEEVLLKPGMSSKPQSYSVTNTSSAKETDSSVSSTKRRSSGPKESMVLIPDTLTSSQRKEYKLVEVISPQSGKGEQIHHRIMESSNLVLKYTGDSSTVPNETPHRGTSNLIMSHSTQAKGTFSSSPPVSAMKRKKRRSKPVAESPLVLTTSNSSQLFESKTRSRSRTPEARVLEREDSADELSFDNHHFADMSNAKESSGRKKRKRKYDSDDDEDFKADELHVFDEVRVTRTSLQSRSASRQSKNGCVDEVDEIMEHTLASERPPCRKSAQRLLVSATATSSKSAERQDESVVPESIVIDYPTSREGGIWVDDTEDKTSELLTTDPDIVQNAPPSTATSASQRTKRKRGRPKKNVVISVHEVENPSLAILVPDAGSLMDATPMEESRPALEEAHVLQEIDLNMPHRSSSSLGKAQKNAQDEDRGVTDEGKTQEDHSYAPSRAHALSNEKSAPLHDESVSQQQRQGQQNQLSSSGSRSAGGPATYRVGLSRRSRIAPLLKVIRK